MPYQKRTKKGEGRGLFRCDIFCQVASIEKTQIIPLLENHGLNSVKKINKANGTISLKPKESAFYPCSNKAVCADESVQRRFVSLLDKTAGHYDDLLSRTSNPDMPSSTGTGKQLFSEGEQITLSCAISVDGEEMSLSCKRLATRINDGLVCRLFRFLFKNPPRKTFIVRLFSRAAIFLDLDHLVFEDLTGIIWARPLRLSLSSLFEFLPRPQRQSDAQKQSSSINEALDQDSLPIDIRRRKGFCPKIGGVSKRSLDAYYDQSNSRRTIKRNNGIV